MNAATRALMGRAYELRGRVEELIDDGKLHPAFQRHIDRVYSWTQRLDTREQIANNPRLAAALEKAKAKREARVKAEQEAIKLDRMSNKADELSEMILTSLKNGNKNTAYMEGQRDALRDMVRNGVAWAVDAACEASEECADDDEYMREWLRGYSAETSVACAQ